MFCVKRLSFNFKQVDVEQGVCLMVSNERIPSPFLLARLPVVKNRVAEYIERHKFKTADLYATISRYAHNEVLR